MDALQRPQQAGPAGTSAPGYRTIPEFFRTCLPRHAAKVGLTCALPNGMTASLTWGDLDRWSDAVAAWLREELKLPPGSMVAIQAPNSLAFPVVCIGVMKAGLVPTAVNPLYTEREMASQLSASGARALFVLDALAGKLPGVLAKTGAMPVVRLSVSDFFPPAKAALINLVARHVKRLVPAFPVPHIPLRQVLTAGEAHARRLGRKGIAAYADGIGPDDMVTCWFTGGTTGRSKGVVTTHRGLLASLTQIQGTLNGPWTDAPMRTLLILPFYHIFGIGMLLQAADLGGHVILIPNPRPLTNLKAAVETFRPTYLPGVPTLFANLLNEPWFVAAAKDSLKLCLSGAAPLAPATQKRWMETFGQPIYELYGMTECGLASCTPLDGRDHTGTIGRILPSLESRIVDLQGGDVPDGEPGELILRGPQVMQGYWQQPAETAGALRDGWLHTGDVVVRDPDGTLRIVDRRKDMILVSGFNVYPSEIEAVITEHPGVTECAAIGIPDGQTGETVKVFVVARDPALTVDALRRHCRETLTGYKVPKQIEIVPELPKSPVGKILKRELRLRDQETGSPAGSASSGSDRPGSDPGRSAA
ncbi:AMP-binding protein [Rhodospirillum centenum]|uniref:Long-chain-fatty-acid--CoA ligase n=1 Tax=Rhodospirillum centenum (strain ATCC 51521 / SW) TaxID=414684 RepID=B6IX68_RHOCS|nr:AMP-binding protein [Rhodospirillum centenum]ACJ00892.1 long-chain-fatty-acid--CoA ligase [Rhodospirillum centenum SW]